MLPEEAVTVRPPATGESSRPPATEEGTRSPATRDGRRGTATRESREARRTRRTRGAPTLGTRRASAPATHITAAEASVSQKVVLDRYRLISPLGTGAFATVWLAVDERLEREVALKVIPQRRVIRARFEREAWAAARLSHPCIVTLYEAAADRDAAYLVTELVRGSTLEDALAEGHVSDRAMLFIGTAICDALAYAHGERIIHRDVKPSNILIPGGSPDAVPPAKLTDFGVAHAIGGDSLTATGDVVGTAAYMAPEQAAGRETRPAADVYALALVLYEGLTGVNPLASVIGGQRATRLGMYLPALRRQRRDLPRELGLGIDLALRPRADERGTIHELRAALEASLPTVSEKTGVIAAPWRPTLRRPRQGRPTWRATHDGHPPPLPQADDPPRSTAPSPPLPLAARALGAAAGAALVGWIAAQVLTSSPLAPAATALAAAGLMLALPRLGFVAAAFFLCILAVAQGHAGDALLLAVGAVVAIVAAPRGRPPWMLAVGAPFLAVVGLAGAWPALAARASTVRGRAALGFTGWIWLALASCLASAPLYVGVPIAGPSGALWSSSLYEATHNVLGGLISSGALAPAPVWALAAVLLPLLVRRRSLTFDAAAVLVWAVLLVLFTEVAISLGHSASPVATLHSAVVGAFAAGAVAIAPSALEAWRTMQGGYPTEEVP